MAMEQAMQSSSSKNTPPIETFGIAKKMAKPLSNNTNTATVSFGFAAKFRQIENQPTDEEIGISILNRDPSKLSSMLTPSSKKIGSQNIEPCYFTVKSKSNKSKKGKGKNK